MLLDVCLGTKTSWKILLVLAEAPGKAVSKREIQSLTKTGNKVLTKFIKVLEKFDIIVSNKIGRTHYYKLNLTSPFTENIMGLISAEKKQLNNPDFYILNILREFTYEITNFNFENILNIILFGSYAKRISSRSSDIDLAIITKNKDPNMEILIADLIEKLQKRFRIIIQSHYFIKKEFDEMCKKKGLEQEIIKDGIQLL